VRGVRRRVVSCRIGRFGLQKQGGLAKIGRGRRSGHLRTILGRLGELPELEVGLREPEGGVVCRLATRRCRPRQIILRARVVDVAGEPRGLALQQQDPRAGVCVEIRRQQFLGESLRIGGPFGPDHGVQ
jgi:hypothetical protein